MIEALLTAIDRLIKLVGYRDKRLHQRFTELFDPTFQDLLTVHGDYLKMFEDVFSALDAAWSQKYQASADPRTCFGKMETAIKMLESRRREFAPVRVKLLLLIKQMKVMSLSPLESRFVDALIEYFPIGAFAGKHYTDSTALLKTLYSEVDYKREVRCIEIREVEDEFTGEEVEKLIRGTEAYYLSEKVSALLDQHRQRWSDVCEAYAPLRIAASNWTKDG